MVYRFYEAAVQSGKLSEGCGIRLKANGAIKGKNISGFVKKVSKQGKRADMQKEFMKYLLTKPDVYLRVWAYIFSLANEMGLAVITKKQVMVEMLRYSTTVSRSMLERILEPDMERNKYLSIESKKKLVSESDYGNSWNAQQYEIQFFTKEYEQRNTIESGEKTTEQINNEFIIAVSEQDLAAEKTTEVANNQKNTKVSKQQTKKQKDKKATEVSVLQYNKGSIEQPNALIISEDIKKNLSKFKIPSWMMKAVLALYVQFYRNIQQENAEANGVKDFKPVDPPISYGEDSRQIRLMVLDFIKMGANDGDQILRCFKRVFDGWHLYPDSITSYYKLAQIKRNLGNIVMHLQTNKSANNQSQNREQQIKSNIEKAGSKDYSGLVKK